MTADIPTGEKIILYIYKEKNTNKMKTQQKQKTGNKKDNNAKT